MCIEMFPKNKINIVFRLLCLISYITVILTVNSISTLMIITVAFCFFALGEKSFRNIVLIIMTIIILWLSYLLNSYLLFRIMLLIDYSCYFLDTSYYFVENEKVVLSENDYIRFNNKKKKKKGSSNIAAIYLTVHLVILFLAIMVG